MDNFKIIYKILKYPERWEMRLKCRGWMDPERWENRRQTGKRTDRAGEKGECEHLMKSEDLRDWIDSLTQDITFEYLGVNGSICPFSRSDISLCYGEKEQSFDSIDALMHAPFFKGKSLTEICSKVNFE